MNARTPRELELAMQRDTADGTAPAAEPVLDIHGLSIRLPEGGDRTLAVNAASFSRCSRARRCASWASPARASR